MKIKLKSMIAVFAFGIIMSGVTGLTNPGEASAASTRTTCHYVKTITGRQGGKFARYKCYLLKTVNQEILREYYKHIKR